MKSKNITFRGSWDALGNYNADDVVDHLGEAYVCLVANIGQVPGGGSSGFWWPLIWSQVETSIELTTDTVAGPLDDDDADEQVQ